MPPKLVSALAAAALFLAALGCGHQNSPPPAGIKAADWTDCLRYYDEARCTEITQASAEANREVDALNAEIDRMKAKQQP